MTALLALLFFTALLLAGIALVNAAGSREASRQALRGRLGLQAGVPALDAGPDGSDGGTRPARAILRDRSMSGSDRLDRVLGRVPAVPTLARLMRQAGMNRRVGGLLLHMALSAAAFALLVLTVSGQGLAALLAGIVAGGLPLLFVLRLRAKRLRMFGEQLPDALDLIRTALQSGNGFVAALKIVADESPEPIATECDTVAEEIKLGLPLREALLGLYDRIDDPNIPVVVTGITVTQESGGNLAEVLGNIAYTVRERFKLLRDAETMTAQGRLSGLLLTSLPALVAAVLYSVAPDYFDPLLSNASGTYMIAYCFLSIAAGHLVIRRLTRIDV